MFSFLWKLIKGFCKLILFLVIILWCTKQFFNPSKPDRWEAIIYPDQNNLWNDIEVGTFSTLETCRSVAKEELHYRNATYTGTYECALNCNKSGGKPYRCDTTSK